VKIISHIELRLSNDQVYRIEANKIAHDRAKNYMDDDSYESPESAYKEEYDYTIGSEEELRDWLLNNMDWYDLDPVFVRDERETRLPRLEVEAMDFFNQEAVNA
jgi:hypothetical protein